MSYALRNSLILCSLLLISLSLGFYWVFLKQPEQIAARQAQKTILDADLRKINAVLSIYETTRLHLDSLSVRWHNQQQVVPPIDTPAQTLAYLNTLSQVSGSSVMFSFFFKGRSDLHHHSANKYAIEGDARFEDLYAFMYHIEHGRPFYSVDQIELSYQERNVNTDDWDWIHFKMIFRAYFDSQSKIQDRIRAATPIVPNMPLHNPFRPLITKTLPENHLGLFETEGATLKGLTQKLAYLEDQKGRTSMLQEGDRVFLGYLDKIDIRRNQVEFVLNKGGLLERQALTVNLHPRQLR